MKLSSAVLSFAAAVAAHGDHDHDQEPLAGPLEGLWYNTLPGDGGTQVQPSNTSLGAAIDLLTGRFSLLGNFHIRSPPVQPLLVHPRKI